MSDVVKMVLNQIKWVKDNRTTLFKSDANKERNQN